MKLKLRKKIRCIFSYYNLARFQIRKLVLGFEYANQLMLKVDKVSILLILRRNGAIVGKGCDIEIGLIFHNCKDYSNLSIGDNCHIGKNCFFDLRDKIIIKDNVTISMQCTFITHQDMGKSSLNKLYGKSRNPIVINENVYIGVNTTLLQKVVVGENSIIAAGSVVINSVSNNIIVGGVPADVINKRN